MKRLELSIRKRILFTVLGVVLFTYFLSLGFLTYRNKQQSLQTAIQAGRIQVEGYANRLSKDLYVSLTLARALSASMQGVTSTTWQERWKEFDRLARQITQYDYSFSEIWATFDYQLQQPDYQYKEGQFEVIYPFWDTAQNIMTRLRDTSGLSTNRDYLMHRNFNEEEIQEPFLLRADSTGKPSYVVGVSVPVRDSSGRAVGLVAINRSVSYFRRKFAEYRPYTDMSLFLLSREMRVIAGPMDELVGQKAEDIFTEIPNFTDKLLLMRQGVLLSELYESNITHKQEFLFSAPVKVADMRQQWTLCMMVNRNSLLVFSDATFQITCWIVLASLVLIFVVLLWLSSRVGGSLANINKTLHALAIGHLGTQWHLHYRTGDEIETMATSINQLLDNMEAKANFAQAIGRGEQDTVFHATEDDVLGQSLLEMQNSLKEAKARELTQREQEEQQAWATKGLALFSEYMRVETNDIVGFTYDILHQLTQYVKADIGAVYLVEKDAEGNNTLSLTSSYAYEVRKYGTAHYEIGEGLVGRCAMEQKRIYITDLPKDYIKIASGLGRDIPNALVLIPILMNDVLQGVLELARFGEFQEYVLRFIENVSGSFAATLVALRNNIQTQHLLREARIRSEEISAQEEEMRQNMEELQTVQEEAARKSAEMESWNRAMQNACCLVEYDTRGYLTYANNEYLSLLRISLSEIVNHHHSEGLEMKAGNAKQYQNFWQDILNGQVKRNIRNTVKRNGLELFFVETYAPIFNERNEVIKVLKIAFNITEYLTHLNNTTDESTEKIHIEAE